MGMKYVILLADGMADYSIMDLGDKTPLAYARTPNMDMIAQKGTLGLVDTIPGSFKPGSDVANLTVLGYDVSKCYSGRGPLEAANMGIKLEPDDVAYRCNLVTLSGSKSLTMADFTAGHITSSEAKSIIDDLQDKFGNQEFNFFPGVGYRHLMVWKNGKSDLVTTPPHDITGRFIEEYLPHGKGVEEILILMQETRSFLQDHPLNLKRVAEGKKPANAIWLWGQGRAPQIMPLTQKYGLKGAVISAVDLLNGIGIYAGLDVIHVEGATGYTDTNYKGKALKALESLEERDFVFVHVEAPDEMGHEGNLKGKVKAIEDFDEKVVGTIINGIVKWKDYRIMVLSDHPTPLSIKTHSSDPSPFGIISSSPSENQQRGMTFSELNAKESGNFISPGYLLMEKFIRGNIFG